ncbi:type VII secretion target [Actinoplanes sp. NPDC051494]|uniref:type VII secretion target n=1 Tax=Actinoplanes sp. NPDC051494 TaxID=3363907 RepID=UPI0037AFA0B8
MAEGFAVDAEQIRAHAANVDAVAAQFGSVRVASSAIARDDAAYGVLCGWISGILEGRHRRQDELISYVEESLRLVGDALVATGQDYDRIDEKAAERIRTAGRAH